MDNAILIPGLNATASGVTDATKHAVRGFVGKYATRTVNFLQLNINGTQKKCAELSDILNENNIHVACFQGTRLNSKLHFNVKGYTTIKKDRVSGAGGGFAFLVKTPEIKYIEILPTSNTSSSTEAQAINILLPNHTITLVNVHHPDNSPMDTNILQDLASTSADTKMILGDFNARSPSWGCKILDSKGDQLEDLADDLNLTILNTAENTYVSKTNSPASVLGISDISYASANNVHWKVLDATISDQFPVLTTLPIVQEPTTQEKRSWNFRKANWNGFTQELENLCSDLPKHNDAEKLLHLLTSCIQKAAKHHITRGKRRNNWIPFWKDHNIKDLIQERDSIGQELQRNNSEELKRNFIEVSHRVEELILESKTEKWAELCSKLDLRKGTSHHWNLLKVLNSSYISMPKNLSQT
ncbi:reverse transcriptase domain-containing protein [Trichonephila clavipes]|uniref:Reverse transcriptase domain-containing protein n=1 Tax=Trichonephila clavipes TaxID=2585209 RepID=A0A8X6RL88_TRICX|nr:reverse transcriptase domain-containing protein [Trichonephila clavipes]